MVLYAVRVFPTVSSPLLSMWCGFRCISRYSLHCGAPARNIAEQQCGGAARKSSTMVRAAVPGARAASSVMGCMGRRINTYAPNVRVYWYVPRVQDLIHGVSSLRAVEVACAHHVMIRAQYACSLLLSPIDSYAINRIELDSQRTIFDKSQHC